MGLSGRPDQDKKVKYMNGNLDRWYMSTSASISHWPNEEVQKDKQHTLQGQKHIITDLQSISNKHIETLMILLGDQNKQVINDVSDLDM